MSSSSFPTSRVLYDGVIEAASSFVMTTGNSSFASFQVNATVNSTAKTFIDYTLATLVIGTTVTYTATAAYNGVAGNAITIAFVAGGTAGAEVVTVVGTAISVSMDVTPVTGSTGTQIKTAIANSAAAAALVTGTGTAAAVQAAQAATPLAGGVNGVYTLTSSIITSTAHGFYTGLKIRLTTTGTLPTGLLTGTDYYVFVCSANTYQLFDTLAHALAAGLNNAGYSTSTGLNVITAIGSNAATHTNTPVALTGCSYKLQKSNDFVDSQNVPNVNNGGTAQNAGNWVDMIAGESASIVTYTITVTGSSIVDSWNCGTAFERVLFAISAGSVKIKVIGHG